MRRRDTDLILNKHIDNRQQTTGRSDRDSILKEEYCQVEMQKTNVRNITGKHSGDSASRQEIELISELKSDVSSETSRVHGEFPTFSEQNHRKITKTIESENDLKVHMKRDSDILKFWKNESKSEVNIEGVQKDVHTKMFRYDNVEAHERALHKSALT